MAVTIVDVARPVLGVVDAHLEVNVAPGLVTGGVDTHLDLNVAAALDGIGGLLAVAEFPATAAGHRELLGWLSGFGPVARPRILRTLAGQARRAMRVLTVTVSCSVRGGWRHRRRRVRRSRPRGRSWP